jgi:hypothetical protein
MSYQHTKMLQSAASPHVGSRETEECQIDYPSHIDGDGDILNVVYNEQENRPVPAPLMEEEFEQASIRHTQQPENHKVINHLDIQDRDIVDEYNMSDQVLVLVHKEAGPHDALNMRGNITPYTAVEASYPALPSIPVPSSKHEELLQSPVKKYHSASTAQLHSRLKVNYVQPNQSPFRQVRSSQPNSAAKVSSHWHPSLTQTNRLNSPSEVNKIHCVQRDKVAKGRIVRRVSKQRTSTGPEQTKRTLQTSVSPEFSSLRASSNSDNSNLAPTKQLVLGDFTNPSFLGIFSQLLEQQAAEKVERAQQQRLELTDEINRLKQVEVQLRADLQSTKKFESDFASRYRDEAAQHKFVNEELIKSKKFSDGLKLDIQKEKVNVENRNKDIIILQDKIDAANKELSAKAIAADECANARIQVKALEHQQATLERHLAEKSRHATEESAMRARLEAQMTVHTKEQQVLTKEFRDNHHALFEKLGAVHAALQPISDFQAKGQLDKLVKETGEIHSSQCRASESLEKIHGLCGALESR